MHEEHWIRQREFHWTQPGKQAEGYLLISGGKPFGTLQAVSTLRESTRGETPFGKWLFERAGFWSPRSSSSRGGCTSWNWRKQRSSQRRFRPLDERMR